MNKIIPFRALCFSAVLFSSLGTVKTYGQYQFIDRPTYEIGISAGPGNLLGDLGGGRGVGTRFIKDNNIKATTLMKGAYISARFSEFLGVTFSANFTTLEGADSLIVNKGGAEVARKNRNLSVKTPLMEAILTAEIYPTVFLENDDKDLYSKFRPYGILGVGVFKFNPKGEYIDQNGVARLVPLQPLRTEGQGMPGYPDRKPYNLTQINIPYGVGIRYYFNQSVSAAIEVVTRKTFTDYLDDVSTTYIADADFDAFFGAGSETARMAKQLANKAAEVSPTQHIPYYNTGDKRGTVSNKDSYYAVALKLGIRLGQGGSSGVIHCPVRF